MIPKRGTWVFRRKISWKRLSRASSFRSPSRKLERQEKRSENKLQNTNLDQRKLISHEIRIDSKTDIILKIFKQSHNIFGERSRKF